MGVGGDKIYQSALERLFCQTEIFLFGKTGGVELYERAVFAHFSPLLEREIGIALDVSDDGDVSRHRKFVDGIGNVDHFVPGGELNEHILSAREREKSTRSEQINDVFAVIQFGAELEPDGEFSNIALQFGKPLL